MRAFSFFLCSLISVGCSAPEPPATAPLVEGEPRLVTVGAATQGPAGSDAVPRSRVAFRMPDGTLRAIDREAIAFVPRFGPGAALVDPERRLYEVTPDGKRRMLAAGASGSLAVSPDGALLAYAVTRGTLGQLRVHDGSEERTLARELASAGALRFAPGAPHDAGGARLYFVGARPGGVAGVWTATVDGARCLTNCELRTGEPWQDRFVALPASADAFEPGPDGVSWTDAEGERHHASTPGRSR